MTPWKTAADSALGSRLLARQDCQHLLLLGAGTMAPHLVRAHLSVRPSIKKITLWNRTVGKASALVEQLSSHQEIQGRSIEVTEDLQAAARSADLISCGTAARRPLIKGEWLKAGCHLDLVGSYTEEMRESDDNAVRRSLVYVDYARFTPEECGDLSQPLGRACCIPVTFWATSSAFVRARCPAGLPRTQLPCSKTAVAVTWT